MMMRGHDLKRTKFFAFAYGYTGFQWSSVKLYKRWSSKPELKKALQGMQVNDEPAAFNHIIGTLYVGSPRLAQGHGAGPLETGGTRWAPDTA